jgi:DNA-binding MarR family transcriptional regulator
MIAHAMIAANPVDQQPIAADGASRALGLWQALTCAHARIVERLDPETSACAVLGSDTVVVLLPLADAPDHQLRMHELAELSHLTRSGLTRRIDRLVEDGLVERVTCPSDRRGAYAQVTPTGLTELANALPHHVSSLERYLASRLDPSEVETLTALLRRL